jgi:hypothetical protein
LINNSVVQFEQSDVGVIKYLINFAAVVRIHTDNIGVWRSWLAYLHGVQGVGSSSLLTPTKQKKPFRLSGKAFFVMALQVRTCKSHLMKKALIQAKPGKGFYCFMVTPWKSAAGLRRGGNLLTAICFQSGIASPFSFLP